ncbi:hypothetical protein B0H14DRAFT_2591166 [Mycena olivaceomarginata]|nr:hypothetical protein B0H14DRAFT_2591166 [Mycena olivaceomarginata]
MLDLLSVTLILCLLASNFNRIVAIVLWVSDYLARPRGPRLVPYFDEQGMSRFWRFNWNGSVASKSEDLSDNDITLSTRPRAQSSSLHNPIQQVPFSWDFWPDGEFQCVVSAQDLQDSGNLATNWVLETTRDRGTTRARSWHKGHELRWRCLGTIECHGKTCPIELAPASRDVDRHKQLGAAVHLRGDSEASTLWGSSRPCFVFAMERVFIHRGFHTHSAFTHSSMRHPDGSMVFMEYVPKHSTRSANQASTIQIAEHTIVDFESDGGSESETAENSNGPITDPIILPAHSNEHSSSFRYDTAKTWIIDDIELNSDEQQEVEDDSEADEQDQLDEY